MLFKKFKFYFSSKNFYELLELNRNSSQRDIKSSFLRLAKIYHPDIYKGKDVDRFKLINEAYKTLKSPEKRREYDNKEFSSNDYNDNNKTYYSGDNDNIFGKKENDLYNRNFPNIENEIDFDAEYHKFFSKKRVINPEDILTADDAFLKL